MRTEASRPPAAGSSATCRLERDRERSARAPWEESHDQERRTAKPAGAEDLGTGNSRVSRLPQAEPSTAEGIP